ncbi:MAG: hypothetical protein PVI60_12460 [Desulfobacteraceae bacterium]
MNRKRIFTIILIATITTVIAAQVSWAGSRAQHRLEGAALGIGALILTKAIIDQHRVDTAVVIPSDRHCGHRRPHHRPAGHWEVQKMWVPAEYKKVWNPGHYNRRGKWRPGRWINIEVEPGHWSERRVWRPYH